ncbi:MAG: MFS transporter [Chromatiaceae bacterium]|nr:MFS transporter [Chromatiaceae bacterium]
MFNAFRQLTGRLFQVERHEFAAAGLSFLFVLTLMVAYYLLRPVRDAMASDWSDTELSWLWTLNFFLSVTLLLLYGQVVARTGVRKLVPGVYLFFSASFLLFHLATHWLEDTRLIDQSFYIWVSFFSLFHISVFWSFMSDIYNSVQAKRLFGLFAAGAGIGAVLGPIVPLLLSTMFGVYNLLLIAALLLLLITPIIRFLQRTSAQAAAVTAGSYVPGDVIGGDFFDGFSRLLSDRFLLGIALFVLLYTVMSSFVYFELKNVMTEYERATRSHYWAMIDLVVNSLAILTALVATSRLATRFSLAFVLALVPALLVVGWLAVAISPGLVLLIGLQIVRRAGNYAITRPGREMLFTGVTRNTRFKTKPVIDVVVYRGGDVLAGWSYTWLAQGVGLGLGAIALVAALLALLWTLTGIVLGRVYEHHCPENP